MKNPKAPDAYEGQDRPIEFGYDAMSQGHVAWLTEWVSPWERRKVRICHMRDGESTGFRGGCDGVIETLRSWAYRDDKGMLHLNDTPMVRAMLERLNRTSDELDQLLSSAFKRVFAAGFRPTICLPNLAGDMQWIPLKPDVRIRTTKDTE